MTLPFRLKLTLWYSALLAGAVVVFSAAVYVLMARALLDNLNDSLRIRVDQSAASANIRFGHLQLPHHPEQTESAYIPTALLTPSGQVADGTVPASLRAWLGTHGTSLRSGFQATSVADLQVASRQIERNGHIAGYAIVWEPRESADKARDFLLLVIMIIGPVLLAAAGLGGWLLAGRAIAPVVSVTEAASTISGSDLSRRVDVGAARDELSRLAATFNAMIDRLQAAVERERRFTADASHELRAPLAVIRAEATLALDRPRTPAEYQHALEIIDNQAEATQELITALLSLTRAESAPEQQQIVIPFDQVIGAAVEQCALLQERGGVGIDVQVDPDLLVRGSVPLLTRAVRNVVDNAIRVSSPDDVVRVCAWQEGERAVLTVEDSGPGIRQEDQQYIFEPFYQVSAARTPGESHGLGLAICERIVAAHGGQVGVTSTLGNGACFRIALPSASQQVGSHEATPRMAEPAGQLSGR